MIRRFLFIVFCLLSYVSAAEEIKYFYTPSCHQCLQVTHEVIPVLKQKGFVIAYYDLSNINNYLLLNQQIGNKQLHPPVLVFKTRYYSGVKQIKSFAKNQQAIGQESAFNKNITFQKNISFWVVTLGGLIDGVNPCAFATIIFLIAFLQYRKYSQREVVFIGLSFCLAVYIIYTLLGLGIIQGIYKFPVFFTLHVWFYRFLAGICLILSLVSFRDAWLIIRKKHQLVTLQLPTSIKKLIHKIIRSKL